MEERICRSIRRGNYIDIAAEANGVTRVTLFAWLKRGRSNDPNDAIYKDFLNALNIAQAEAEARDVDLLDDMIHGRPEQVNEDGTIVDGFKPHPSLLTWRLERRHPGRWGRSDRVAITADIDAKVDVKVDALTDAELADKIAALSAQLLLPPRDE